MSYQVLALDPNSRYMSLPVLKAIHKLVEDGAVVAGPKPLDDPSLAEPLSAPPFASDDGKEGELVWSRRS